jgi:non-heme chloroperoxidase
MNWRFPVVLKILADDYRVITLDNRGHGKSDKPTEAEQYGSKMVTDVIGLLDHLKIDKAHFVGYSMGGMMTMKLAAVAPHRVHSAVIGGMGWTPLGPIMPERIEGERERSAALRACARAFPDLGITREELEAIQVPMIVVIGVDDGLLESRVKPLSEVRPEIRVVKIPEANHISCIFRPAFRESIKEFLDQQASLVRP